MAIEVIAAALSAIESGFKAVELWEKYGPARQDIQVLNLQASASELRPYAQRIQGTIGDALDDVLRGTENRIVRCLKNMATAAAEDGAYLPQEREQFGKAARQCICRELQIVRDLIPNEELPHDLERLSARHACRAS